MAGETYQDPKTLESSVYHHILTRLYSLDLSSSDQELTAGHLAEAFRKLAIDEQTQMSPRTYNYITSLALTTQNQSGHQIVDQSGNESHDIISSPLKKARITTSDTVQIPPGNVRSTTEHTSTEGNDQDHETPPFDNKNLDCRHVTPEPTHEGIGQPVTPRSGALTSNPSQGSPMRRHGGIPSGTSPSQLRPQMGDDIPGFSSGIGASQRKAAPSRLNLALPGAAPNKTMNHATHYVAMPSYVKTPELNMPVFQAQVTNYVNMRVKLLTEPICNLEPEDVANSFAPLILRPMPQTPATDLANSFKKFTLATPATVALGNAVGARLMAVTQRGEIESTDESDTNETGVGTAQLDPTQPEYLPHRADQALEASHNGRGNSRRLTQLALGMQSRIALSLQSPPPASGHRTPPFDLVTALSRYPELIMAVAEYLSPRDVLTLYTVSLQFHVQMNTYLQSTIKALSRQWAPDAVQVFKWKSDPMYKHLTIRDPAGRVLSSASPELEGNPPTGPLLRRVKQVPSMRYYQMVAFRDDIVIDILAHMARYGLRCPQGTKASVLKLWMLMDQPTNKQREELLMKSRIFADQDLVNLIIFMTKINFRINDPIYGPESTDLSELMFGQRSLYPLWQMLFGLNYRDLPSLLRCKIRYDLGRDWRLGQDHLGAHSDPDYLRPDGPGLLGVPPNEIGRTQLEFWGTKGPMYPVLQRPSACIMAEAARRDLRLDQHVMGFLLWGHMDSATGRNMVPSEAEIWMRDSDHKNRAIDTHLEFEPFHLRRARWDELDERGRKRILLAQEVRHENVYKWDEHRFDDAVLYTAEENLQINRDLSEDFLQGAGVDRDSPDFRVDKNGNEILKSDMPAAAPITGGFPKLQEKYEHDFGYESDSSANSPTVQMAIGDSTMLQRIWKPIPEDHEMHVPYLSAASLVSAGQFEGDDLDQGPNLDDQSMSGDVSFEEDEEPDQETVWENFSDMRQTAFSPWMGRGGTNMF
jgi:hypothetical protein